MTNSQREAIAAEILPALNEMQNQNNVGIIVAEIVKPVTMKDLLALTDVELEELQKLVNSTRSVKKTQENGKAYDKHFNTTLTSEPKKNYSIK